MQKFSFHESLSIEQESSAIRNRQRLQDNFLHYSDWSNKSFNRSNILNFEFHLENSKTWIFTLFILQMNTLQPYIITTTYHCIYLYIQHLFHKSTINLVSLLSYLGFSLVDLIFDKSKALQMHVRWGWGQQTPLTWGWGCAPNPILCIRIISIWNGYISWFWLNILNLKLYLNTTLFKFTMMWYYYTIMYIITC